jgi:4-oxalocrotonate tautomerase
MPFVNVRTVKGLLTEEQKREIQKRITDVMVDVEGRGVEAFRANVWVLVEEIDAENWCVGGRSLTQEMIAQLKAAAGR